MRAPVVEPIASDMPVHRGNIVGYLSGDLAGNVYNSCGNGVIAAEDLTDSAHELNGWCAFLHSRARPSLLIKIA